MDLDIELDEVEEGDVIACEECGTEYEVVGVEPLELARVDGDLDEDDEPLQRKRRKSEVFNSTILLSAVASCRPGSRNGSHGGLIARAG
jgi:alpha-aminoadipate carrier protein LysW